MKDLQRIYQYLFWSGLFTVCLMVSAGCAQTETDEKQELIPLHIGITSSYQGEAAAYVALEKEFFQANGLDVTLKSNPSGKVSLRDLFDGTVQIAHVSETPVLYSLLDSTYYPGLSVPPFEIFADMVYSNKIQKIIARKDHGITDPLDIIGKKIALLKGTQLDYFFDSFLLEHQISKDEFDVINMEPSEQLDAIQNGEIDVAVLWEPYASFAQNKLGDNAANLETDLTYSTLWLSTTLVSYAKSHREVLKSYLRSIKMAQEYIKEHPEYTQELLSRKTDVPLYVVKSLWTEIDFELSLSERMLTLLEDQGRWMIRNNFANKSISDMQQFVNFSPMQEVYPRGITVVR